MEQKLDPGSQILLWFLIIQFPAGEENLWFILWLQIRIFYKWADRRIIKIIEIFGYKAIPSILEVSRHFF